MPPGAGPHHGRHPRNSASTRPGSISDDIVSHRKLFLRPFSAAPGPGHQPRHTSRRAAWEWSASAPQEGGQSCRIDTSRPPNKVSAPAGAMATAASLPVELEPLCQGSVVEGRDAHWDAALLPQLPHGADSVLGGTHSAMDQSTYSSRLLTMRDGVRVAVDVLVPEDRGGGGPRDFVFVQARYGRAYRLRHPYKDVLWGGKPVDVVYLNWKPLWLAAGLAVVTLDIRGCGASFGTWSGPWSEAELSDSLEVLAWAAAQPWAAEGKALLFGQSYDAGCALHTASCAPPGSVAGVLAVNLFLDMFQDISFPGGCFQRQFGSHWSGIIRAFDSQRLGAAPVESSMLALVARGVARALPEEELPAPGATLTWLQRRTARRRRQALLEAAVLEHATNWAPLADGPPHVAFMDDVAPTLGKSIADTNCARLLPALAASGIPILWTSAWFDATVSSAASGFAATRHIPGTQLLIGPWTQCCGNTSSPPAAAPPASPPSRCPRRRCGGRCNLWAGAGARRRRRGMGLPPSRPARRQSTSTKWPPAGGSTCLTGPARPAPLGFWAPGAAWWQREGRRQQPGGTRWRCGCRTSPPGGPGGRGC